MSERDQRGDGHPERPRRRSWLRRGWPWGLIVLAAVVGGVTTGVSGALVLAGFATLIWGRVLVGLAHGRNDRVRCLLVAAATGLVGVAAALTGGYLGGR